MNIPRNKARGAVLAALATAVGAWSCQPTRSTEPDPATVEAGGGGSRATAQSDDNQPPAAVFRTRPQPDADGMISGGSVLDVTFNLCQSSDPDPGDELKFTFDFDGDGTVDTYGHCRATHRYEVGRYESACVHAVVCVSDRQPDHRICRTYKVCTLGAAPPSPRPEPSPPTTFTEQTIEGDLSPIASRDAWAFTGEPGTEVTVEVDTLSEETAYTMSACVSTTPRLLDCIRPTARSRVACTFPPRTGLGCPHRTVILPPDDDGVYYLIVGGFRLALRVQGMYTADVTARPGIGALALEVDNGEHPASVEP